MENQAVKQFLQQAPKMFDEVLELSLNETARTLKRYAKTHVPKKWGVREDIDEVKPSRIKEASAQAGARVAEILLGGKSISLFKLNSVSPRGIMGGKTHGGVTINIMNQSFNRPHAFITGMGKEKIKGIFERMPNKSGGESIKKLYTSHIAGMTKSDKTEMPSELDTLAQEIFERDFVKRCEFRLTQMGAK
jgi:hypothetical protein